jgi:hypothetical protein
VNPSTLRAVRARAVVAQHMGNWTVCCSCSPCPRTAQPCSAAARGRAWAVEPAGMQIAGARAAGAHLAADVYAGARAAELQGAQVQVAHLGVLVARRGRLHPEPRRPGDSQSSPPLGVLVARQGRLYPQPRRPGETTSRLMLHATSAVRS